MGKPYYVREDYTPGKINGQLIKRFRHEHEALAFITDKKNIQQYNGMTLYATSQDGEVYKRMDDGSWEME